MTEKKTFEDNPLYRLFNVILFILYSFVFLIGVIAAIIGYGEREIVSATVVCRDGTRWDALKPKNILYDSDALCGICTKRKPSDTYTECTYEDFDYDSYETEVEKELWSWATIIYPAIVVIFGIGLVDFLKIALIYIFSGEIHFEKSLLLKIITLLSQPDAGAPQDLNGKPGEFDEKYRLLLKIVDRKEITDMAILAKRIEVGLDKAESDLEDFLKRVGHNRKFFESAKSLDLDLDILEEHYKLDNAVKDLKLGDLRLRKYFETLDLVNAELEEGVGIGKAKKTLKRLQKKNADELAEFEVKHEFSKAIGEELIELKRKHGRDYKKKKIKVNDIIERIYKKHPEWRELRKKRKSQKKK